MTAADITHPQSGTTLNGVTTFNGVIAGDQFTLTWGSSSPYGSIMSNTHNGPNNWTGVSGTTVTPPAGSSNVYIVTSTDSNLLTSSSTVIINVGVAATGTCGSDAATMYITTPVNLCGASNTSSGFSPNGSNNGWTWTCKPTAGGTPTTCNAMLQAAACGSNVTADITGTVTSGTACTVGTASATIDPTTGQYTCTNSVGGVSNNQNCTAAVASLPACGAPYSTEWIKEGFDAGGGGCSPGNTGPGYPNSPCHVGDSCCWKSDDEEREQAAAA